MDWDFISNLEVTSDKVDTIPDAVKGYYAEDKAAGKFVLKADVRPLAESLTRANARIVTLGKSRSEDSRKDAGRRVAIEAISNTLIEEGVDVGEDQSKLGEILKTKIVELRAASKGGKDVEKAISDAKAAYQTNLDKVKKDAQAEVGKMQTTLEKYMIEGAGSTALAEANTTDGSIQLLLPQIKSRAQLVKTDSGDYVVQVKEGDAVAYNTNGEPKTVKDIVEDLKKLHPNCFKSTTNASGSGTKTKPTDANAQQRIVKGTEGEDTRTPAQQLSDGMAKRFGKK